ncbi:MAG: cupin domain-containing protein [Nanoarchaeota archaeon]|nr:cupin domain-containing protein [Nanoarchaeota archaeon]MBU0977864.1 cupin domain-containing protein [Nanoarchaeota archaeon]
MRIVSKKDIKKPFKAELGEIIYEMIGHPKDLGGTTKHSFVHVILPPGKSSQAHYHKISEETYYILKGSATLTVNEQKVILKEGQACLIMPGEVHKIDNTENKDVEFLTISAPAWDQRDSHFS